MAKTIKAAFNKKNLTITVQLLLVLCTVLCLAAASTVRSLLYAIGFWAVPILATLFGLCLAAVHAADARKREKTALPKSVLVLLAAVSVLLTGLLYPVLSERTAVNVIELYCGEKSDASLGAEIWLHSYEVDGEWVDAASMRIQQQTNFTFNDARQEYSYVPVSDGEGYLRIEMPAGRKVNLIFLRHSYAGIVNVSVNKGEKIPVDTYALESDFYTVELQVKEGAYHDPISLGLLVLGALGCFCLLLGIGWMAAAAQLVRHKDSTTKSLFLRTLMQLFSLFAAGFVLWFFGTDRAAQGGAFWIRLLSLLAVVAFGIYVFVLKGIFSEVFWESAKKKTVLAVAGTIALCITLLASSVLADRAFPNIVEIFCGEKNEQSLGAQVWLSTYTVDGKTRNIQSLRTTEAKNTIYQGKWNVYRCSGGKGYLRIELPRCTSADLGFVGYERGGIIEISVNGGEPQRVDLYSAHTTDLRIPLDGVNSVKHGVDAYILLAAEFCGCFSLFFLAATGLGALAIKAKADTRENRRLIMTATVLLPVSVLLYFYKNNVRYIALKYLALLGIGLVVLYALLFWIVNAAVRSSMATWVCGILLTVFFFKTDLWNSVFPQLNVPEAQQVVFALGITALLSLAIAVLAQRVKLKSNRILSVFLLIFTGAVCTMNVLGILPTVKERVFADRASAIKEDYVVEATKAADIPHIYWLHCDGLLGFSSVEKYYQDDQAKSKEELADRGFVINETAYFAAGRSTNFCVTALMCPDFYDSTMQPGISQSKNDYVWCNQNRSLLETALKHNELIEAFQMVGSVNSVGVPSTEEVYFYDSFYLYKNNSILKRTAWDNAQLQNDLVYISIFTSRFIKPVYSIVNRYRNDFDPCNYVLLDGNSLELQKETDFYTEETLATREAMKNQDATLTIIMLGEAHYPFGRDENGEWVKEGTRDPLDYYPQHQYALKVVLATVDMILEQDPDAVIVLQSDHGLHGSSRSSFKEAFGEEADADELWNQVFSAVRIPEQYWNGEEHYAYENPLNISRYLVNRFIGENYEYIGE